MDEPKKVCAYCEDDTELNNLSSTGLWFCDEDCRILAEERISALMEEDE